MAPAVLPATWEVAGDPEGTFTPATLAGPVAGTALGAGEEESGTAVELPAVGHICLAATSTDRLKC